MLAQIKIAPVKSAILIIYDWFNYLIISYLLSDAEISKDISEDFVGCHLADDFGEVAYCGAEGLADKVAGQAAGEACLHFSNVS